MAKLTPEEFREKQARRLKANLDDVRKGVLAVSTAPTAQAAAKIDKMRANINEAIDSGKVERGLKRVDLKGWQDATVNKGVNRIAAGIDAAAAKVESFASELLPYQDRLKAELDRLPDMSFEDSLARMTYWARGMKKFERKG